MNEPNEVPVVESPKSNSRYRLVVFVAGAILIAFITSSISLSIYTSSGDIYLDRSRPGFIPDKPSTDNGQTDQTTSFPPEGLITKDALDDYLQKLDTLIKDITADHDSFSSSALSDEALNITGSTD
jgi:hypothetical protein